MCSVMSIEVLPVQCMVEQLPEWVYEKTLLNTVQSTLQDGQSPPQLSTCWRHELSVAAWTCVKVSSVQLRAPMKQLQSFHS